MATVHQGHPHDEPHDDESLLGDDLIEADDGEYYYSPLLTVRVLARC